MDSDITDAFFFFIKVIYSELAKDSCNNLKQKMNLLFFSFLLGIIRSLKA